MSLDQLATSRTVHVVEQGIDLDLHYHDAGTGEVVIPIHGGGPGATGWSNWSRNLDALVDAGYRVIVPDTPGFGKSGPIVTDQPMPLLNAWAIKGLMDQLGIDRAHLVGNSLGGTSALFFALEYPERLDRMVLMGCSGLGKSVMQPVPTEGIRRLGSVFEEPTMDVLRHMLDIFVYDTESITDELVQARYEAMMNRPEHLTNMVESSAHPGVLVMDLTARLSQISHKTLVTAGRDDRFVPLDLALKLLWNLPNADLHVFSQCGHWAQWEHAESFNRLLLDFLRG